MPSVDGSLEAPIVLPPGLLICFDLEEGWIVLAFYFCRGGVRAQGGIGLRTVSEAVWEQSADLRRRRACRAFAGAGVT